MTVNIETAAILIKERTHQLVCELIRKRGYDHPPFLSEDYAPLLGVLKIEKMNLEKAGGLLLRYRNGPIIKINQNDPTTRQNFSCAHELGHLLFSDLKLEQYTNSIEQRYFNPQIEQKQRMKAVEKICDLAATELLMPESFFGKHLNMLGTSINSIEHLAETYRVSMQSAAIRTSELSEKKCVVFKWEQLNKNTNTLVLKWPRSRIKERKVYSPTNKIVSSPSKLHEAFVSNKAMNLELSFKVGKETKQLPTEIKCFGSGEYKYILSLTMC
jgi:Zn-dependent peptidase ImmA (M78 family)